MWYVEDDNTSDDTTDDGNGDTSDDTTDDGNSDTSDDTADKEKEDISDEKKDNNKETTDSPKTGDTSNALIYMICATISLFVVLGISLRKKIFR